MDRDPFKHHFRLKRPCENCPFLTHGAIELMPGRLEGIIRHLLQDDQTSFHCHKTVHSEAGGEWSDDNTYTPAGSEAMCAGAAALLMKRGMPNVMMRAAIALGSVPAGQWNCSFEQVID